MHTQKPAEAPASEAAGETKANAQDSARVERKDSVKAPPVNVPHTNTPPVNTPPMKLKPMDKKLKLVPKQ